MGITTKAFNTALSASIQTLEVRSFARGVLTQLNFEQALRDAIAEMAAYPTSGVEVEMPMGLWTLEAGVELKSLPGLKAGWLKGQGNGVTILRMAGGFNGTAIKLNGNESTTPYASDPNTQANKFYIGGLADFRLEGNDGAGTGIECVNLLLSKFSDVSALGFGGTRTISVAGTTTSGSPYITNVASVNGLDEYMPVSVTGAFPAGTRVKGGFISAEGTPGIGPYKILMSANATTSGATTVQFRKGGVGWHIHALTQVQQTCEWWRCGADINDTGWIIHSLNSSHWQTITSNQNHTKGVVLIGVQGSIGGGSLFQSTVPNQIEIPYGGGIINIHDSYQEGASNSFVWCRGNGELFDPNNPTGGATKSYIRIDGLSHTGYSTPISGVVDIEGDLYSTVVVRDIQFTGGGTGYVKARNMGNIRIEGQRDGTNLDELDLDGFSRSNAVSIHDGEVQQGNHASQKTLSAMLAPYCAEIFDVSKYGRMVLSGTDFVSATGSLHGSAISLMGAGSTSPQYQQSNPYFAGAPSLNFNGSCKTLLLTLATQIPVNNATGLFLVYRNLDFDYNQEFAGLKCATGNYGIYYHDGSVYPKGWVVGSWNPTTFPYAETRVMTDGNTLRARAVLIASNMFNYAGGGLSGFAEETQGQIAAPEDTNSSPITGCEIGGYALPGNYGLTHPVAKCQIAYVAVLNKPIGTGVSLEIMQTACDRFGV